MTEDKPENRDKPVAAAPIPEYAAAASGDENSSPVDPVDANPKAVNAVSIPMVHLPQSLTLHIRHKPLTPLRHTHRPLLARF